MFSPREFISFFFREMSHSCSKGMSRIGRKGNRGRSGRGIIREINQIAVLLDLDSTSGGPLLVGTIASKMSLPSAFEASSRSVVFLLFFVRCSFTDRGRGTHLVVITRRKTGTRWSRATPLIGSPILTLALSLPLRTVPGPSVEPLALSLRVCGGVLFTM